MREGGRRTLGYRPRARLRGVGPIGTIETLVLIVTSEVG